MTNNLKKPWEVKLLLVLFLYLGVQTAVSAVAKSQTPILPILFVVVAIGIFFFQTWAYYLAFSLGVLPCVWAYAYLVGYLRQPSGQLLGDGIIHLVVGILWYVLLLRERIKELYPPNWLLLCSIGLLLILSSLSRVGIFKADFFRQIISIMGLAMMLYASTTVRKQGNN